MRKATKIGFIAVFCAAVGLTFPVFNIFSKQLSMDSHENRLMTGLPQVLQSPLSSCRVVRTIFLSDNSPFRYQFVLLNAGIGYRRFWHEPKAIRYCPARMAGCFTRTAPPLPSLWPTTRV